MPAPKDPEKYKHWKEKLRQISLEQFKNGMPKETKDKIRKALKGRVVSKETKDKIRKTLKGHIVSEETRNRIKAGMKIGKTQRYREWSGKSYLDSNGYSRFTGGKNKDKKEHRILAESLIGRLLKKKETVHHINGTKDDNRPENLYLFSSGGEHTKFEHLKNKPILTSNIYGNNKNLH